jgi:hypothetical protein
MQQPGLYAAAVARDWTLSLRDGHGDLVEITVTEAQARRFMAGQGVAYWTGCAGMSSLRASGQSSSHPCVGHSTLRTRWAIVLRKR